jgi:hypothetical protein
VDIHSSSSRGHLVGRQFYFCPSCDERLRNREYLTFFYKACGWLLGMGVQFRWQCPECGYREKGRTNWPLGLAFSGGVLALSSFALDTEYSPTGYEEIFQLAKSGLLYTALGLVTLGTLIFFARLLRSNPVLKTACSVCDRYFVRSEGWASTEFCSIECVQDKAEENEEFAGQSSESGEDVDDEDIEEVDEDEEEIEDVEDVEDDIEEDTEDSGNQINPAPTDKTPETVEAKTSKDPEAESKEPTDKEDPSAAAPAEDEVPEMVLFEDKTEYEIWDRNKILSEVDEELDLDNVNDDDEDEEEEAAEENIDNEEVEDALSLMESQRTKFLDRSAMWKVEDILAQTDDLDIMASTRMSKSIGGDLTTEEIAVGRSESGEDLEGSGDTTE